MLTSPEASRREEKQGESWDSALRKAKSNPTDIHSDSELA